MRCAAHSPRSTSTAPPDLIRLDPRINVVRLGVNYRFGWGGDAVIAKY
jgi:hypothetical protein